MKLLRPALLALTLLCAAQAAAQDAYPSKAILALQGLDSTPSSPEEFSAFLRAELLKWAKVVKDTGSQPD